MRLKSLAMQTISNGVSLARLPFAPRYGLRILTYHAIDSSAYGDHLGLNTISVELFRKHLDMLTDVLTTPLIPLEMPLNKLHIAITFDDGYADNLHIAAPLLVERGIPFTVFVTSDFVRSQMDSFLSPNELKQLSQLPGVTIGAHSRSHCNLTQCSNESLRAELEDSKHYLEDLIGMSVTCLAYPYGATNMRVRNAAQCTGYKIGTCSRFDINRTDRDALMLNRLTVLHNDSPRVLHQKLRGDWDWYRWRNVDPLKIEDFRP